MEYGDSVVLTDDGEASGTEALQEPGVEVEDDTTPAVGWDVDQAVAGLPKVQLRLDATPEELMPGRFLAAMVDRVLGITPVTMHREARKRRNEAAQR